MEYPWTNPAAWHAINVHMPVALAMIGIPLACLVAITRGGKPWLRWTTTALYGALILFALVAVQSGERAMDALPTDASKAAWDQVDLHQRMAEQIWIFGAATLSLLLITAIPRKSFRQIGATLATVASVITGVWVMLVGHAGGTLVYQYGLGVPKSAAISPATQPVVAIAGDSSATVSFSKQVQPLIKEKCLECHSADSPKGKFEMSSVATMFKAGRKAGPGIVAHKPDESAIIQYVKGIKQPQMPKGDPPLSPDEIALLSNWIAAGALDDSEGPPALAPALAVAPDSPPAPSSTRPASPTASNGLAVAATLPASPATDAPTTGPVAQAGPVPTAATSNAWNPAVSFNPVEMIAVRRYVRMQLLPPAPAVPQVEAPISNPIDAFIVDQWKHISGPTAGVTPELCDDATFVRRIYLDLIGIIPPASEARSFVEDQSPDKRSKLIDALLARSDDYAANWVPFWEDALCSNGNHQGGVGTHGNYRRWVLESFRENKPFDVMVTELLDPTMPDNPGRYVLNQDHTRTVQSAADTAQVFMGTAIKCASCHNHFENQEWPQARAAAFAGFFGPKDLELIRCERKTGNFIPTSFLFSLPGAPQSVPVDDQSARLKRVAQMIVDPTNPRFAPTIVNRLWKRYLGLGISEPVDDFREDRKLNHAPLLAWLAHDFIEHGYDIKHTVRLIVNSRTYQFKFDPSLQDSFDVAKQQEPRYYRSPTLRRLTAEQLLDSIAAATGEAPSGKARLYASDESTPLTRALGKPPTRNEVSTARPEDTAVVQALELLNGPEYFERVYGGAMVKQLSMVAQAPALAERLYWSVLSRAPGTEEIELAEKFLASVPRVPVEKPDEAVWVDDDIPAGAQMTGEWEWRAEGAEGAPSPVIGDRVHTLGGPIVAEHRQHLINGVNFSVGPGDTLFAYVYLDPAQPTKQIMVQWHIKGGEWVRAGWGEKVIPFTPQTAMGLLPSPGQWVRLEVPAGKVGLTADNAVVDGISFDQAGGRVYWDKAGVVRGVPAHDPAVIGDMVWSLVTSPEFQYIR